MGRISEGQKAGRKSSRMTDRQRAFVDEYTKDYNATRAAKAVGYKSPAEMGRQLVIGKYPKVAEAIAGIQKRNAEKNKATKETLIQELSNIINRDPIEIFENLGEGVIVIKNLDEIPPHVRRCVESIKGKNRYNREGEVIEREFEIKFASKVTAIDMLMKHFGMYAPQEVNVKASLDWDSVYRDGEEDVDNLNVIEGKIAKAGENK